MAPDVIGWTAQAGSQVGSGGCVATEGGQLYVLQHLQAPSSAAFSHSAAIAPSDDGGYLIRGSVDAQNAFGVKLRRNYLCAVDSAGRVMSGGVLE